MKPQARWLIWGAATGAGVGVWGFVMKPEKTGQGCPQKDGEVRPSVT